MILLPNIDLILPLSLKEIDDEIVPNIARAVNTGDEEIGYYFFNRVLKKLDNESLRSLVYSITVNNLFSLYYKELVNKETTERYHKYLASHIVDLKDIDKESNLDNDELEKLKVNVKIEEHEGLNIILIEDNLIDLLKYIKGFMNDERYINISKDIMIKFILDKYNIIFNNNGTYDDRVIALKKNREKILRVMSLV